MNSVTVFLGTFSHLLQGQLFPILTEELGPLGERHQALVRALALLQLDGVVTRRQGRGRRPHDRANVARAFLAKAIFNLPHTRALLDRLAHDPTLRRLCGWEKAAEVPEESVFSRAFSEFADSEFAQRVHFDAVADRYRPRSLNAPKGNGWWATFSATPPRLKPAKSPHPSPLRRLRRARAGCIARPAGPSVQSR